MCSGLLHRTGNGIQPIIGFFRGGLLLTLGMGAMGGLCMGLARELCGLIPTMVRDGGRCGLLRLVAATPTYHEAQPTDVTHDAMDLRVP